MACLSLLRMFIVISVQGYLSFLVNWSIGAISVDSWLRETLSKSIQNRIWLAAVLSLKAFVLIT